MTKERFSSPDIQQENQPSNRLGFFDLRLFEEKRKKSSFPNQPLSQGRRRGGADDARDYLRLNHFLWHLFAGFAAYYFAIIPRGRLAEPPAHLPLQRPACIVTRTVILLEIFCGAQVLAHEKYGGFKNIF